MSQYPIVGAHFRPPAKAILASLPAGAALSLVPEPSNPFDSNAIAVFVEPKEIPPSEHEALTEVAAGMGFEIEDILTAPAWHLGYIPKALAAAIVEDLNDAIANLGDDDELVLSYPGILAFNMKGAPQVVFHLPKEEE
jgi:hypothetical protein